MPLALPVDVVLLLPLYAVFLVHREKFNSVFVVFVDFAGSAWQNYYYLNHTQP